MRPSPRTPEAMQGFGPGKNVPAHVRAGERPISATTPFFPAIPSPRTWIQRLMDSIRGTGWQRVAPRASLSQRLLQDFHDISLPYGQITGFLEPGTFLLVIYE